MIFKFIIVFSLAFREKFLTRSFKRCTRTYTLRIYMQRLECPSKGFSSCSWHLNRDLTNRTYSHTTDCNFHIIDMTIVQLQFIFKFIFRGPTEQNMNSVLLIQFGISITTTPLTKMRLLESLYYIVLLCIWRKNGKPLRAL